MQINESINASNFLSIGINTSQKNGPEDTANSDFASFLKSSDSGKTKDSVSAEKELFPERKDNDLSNKNMRSEVNKQNDTGKETAGRETVAKDNGSKLKKTEKAANISENNSDVLDNEVAVDDFLLNEDLDGSDEIMDAVMEIISDVLQVITDNFDMSAQDVQTNLNELGMDFGDLATEEGVKTFYLDVSSAEVSDLLTDENLATDLQNLLSEFNEIVEAKDVPPQQISEKVSEKPITLDDVKDYVDVLASDEVAVNDTQDITEVKKQDDTGYVFTENAEQNKESEVKVVVRDNRESKSNQEPSHEKKSMNTHTDNLRSDTNPIVQGLNEAVNFVEEVAAVSESATGQADIVEQIVEQIRININQDNTSMEMQLYPEHLGRIQIHVVSKDGVMTARIAAETEAAKQAIEAGLNNLKESFSNQNLKVEAIEVMVSTTGFAESDQQREEYQQQGAGKRNSRGGVISDVEDETTEDETESRKMQAEGSSVSYLA